MADKAVILCAFALLIQSIAGQCFGNPFNYGFANPKAVDGLGLASALPYGPAIGYGAYGPALGPASIAPAIAPASGGGFQVTSASPIVPTGLAVLSENLAIDGGVAVGGQMPFLGTVGLDGVFPSAGVGGVSYGCGDGAIGITAEGAYASGVGYRAGMPGVGYRGCGALY